MGRRSKRIWGWVIGALGLLSLITGQSGASVWGWYQREVLHRTVEVRSILESSSFRTALTLGGFLILLVLLVLVLRSGSLSGFSSLGPTRRRPLSQLTNDELYDATLAVAQNLWNLSAVRMRKRAVVEAYRSRASVNVQALTDELDRRGYGRPGLSQLAREATSLADIGAVSQHLRIASNQIGLEERDSDTPVSTEEPASKPDELAPALTGTGERIFTDATPERLTGFFKEHMNIQAARLADTYLGKWMKVSGPLGNVGVPTPHRKSQVTFAYRPNAVNVYMRFSDKKWVDRLQSWNADTK